MFQGVRGSISNCEENSVLIKTESTHVSSTLSDANHAKSYVISGSCLDLPYFLNRFHVTYVMRDLITNQFAISLNKTMTFVTSLASIYKSLKWIEREIAETFGLLFKGNTDQRRLLLDYSFNIYPFRKDYSLNVNINVNNMQCMGCIGVILS